MTAPEIKPLPASSRGTGTRGNITRRAFLAMLGAYGAAPLLAKVPSPSTSTIGKLRRAIVDSPVSVGLHRAEVFTRIYQRHADEPWIVRKALSLREYFETVPLYLREHDALAGSISERPGAMPVIVELGIGENGIYTGEVPHRAGYLKGRVPGDIRDYWKNRNAWGLYRTQILGKPPVTSADEVPQTLNYKFLSNQGHLSPDYGELLRVGLAGVLRKVRRRREGKTNAERNAFLISAEHVLVGLSRWIERYAEFLELNAGKCDEARRADELRDMSRIAAKVAAEPPQTFREAMQLVWFVHQAIHIEGHGYSCTPDRIDQILFPFYEADRKAGRLDDPAALRLIENFVLKMYDNTFWGPEHHLTQGICLSGSTADERDQTNRLSWLFVEGATNLSLPEPLIWIRWHPNIDQKFFDFCLTRLLRSTCFPMMWNDKAIPEALMELGVAREDAFNYVAVGCNELGIPGQFYFNPGASVNYLGAIEKALTSGRGYKGNMKAGASVPSTAELKTFGSFSDAVGRH
ncbi:MAG: pyruvate formate lyase family protein, partial [Planctomycetota bacterium]